MRRTSYLEIGLRIGIIERNQCRGEAASTLDGFLGRSALNQPPTRGLPGVHLRTFFEPSRQVLGIEVFLDHRKKWQRLHRILTGGLQLPSPLIELVVDLIPKM